MTDLYFEKNLAVLLPIRHQGTKVYVGFFSSHYANGSRLRGEEMIVVMSTIQIKKEFLLEYPNSIVPQFHS